jgi:hypothetical protein
MPDSEPISWEKMLTGLFMLPVRSFWRLQTDIRIYFSRSRPENQYWKAIGKPPASCSNTLAIGVGTIKTVSPKRLWNGKA